MSEPIKRYTMAMDVTDGLWVLYADHERELTALKAKNDRLRWALIKAKVCIEYIDDCDVRAVAAEIRGGRTYNKIFMDACIAIDEVLYREALEG